VGLRGDDPATVSESEVMMQRVNATFRALSLASALLLVPALGGCANDAQTGALLGGGIGAASGAVIGHQSDEAGAGAAIGGAVGAGTGYIIGNESDKAKD
jgi:hypothetical protein